MTNALPLAPGEWSVGRFGYSHHPARSRRPTLPRGKPNDSRLRSSHHPSLGLGLGLGHRSCGARPRGAPCAQRRAHHGRGPEQHPHIRAVSRSSRSPSAAPRSRTHYLASRTSSACRTHRTGMTSGSHRYYRPRPSSYQGRRPGRGSSVSARCQVPGRKPSLTVGTCHEQRAMSNEQRGGRERARVVTTEESELSVRESLPESRPRRGGRERSGLGCDPLAAARGSSVGARCQVFGA